MHMKRLSILVILAVMSAGILNCAVETDHLPTPASDPAPTPAPLEYHLDISSTAGGEVTTPGEGRFAYEEGTEVIITAAPSSGYIFDRWTGDVATVFNVNMASTIIRMNGDCSVTANFEPDPLQVRAQRAMEIHEQAVEMVLDKAERDSHYKYAIYTSRTLMVKHPEIYLKADGLFLETVQNNDGFKKSYEITSVNDPYLLGNALTGPPFSFDLVDFTKYHVIESSAMYPEDYPFLPYVDRRLLTMTVTLKPVGNRVTQLAKAEQHYFALKESGATADLMYLIYCDNENAYLYHQGALISALDLEETERIEGNPILVFNESNVWYPLMGRDDTGANAALRNVVEQYATGVALPELTDSEAEMVARFAEMTALEPSQVNMAIIAASRNWRFHRFAYEPFRSIWGGADIRNFQLHHPNAHISLLHDLILKSNHLSPIAAYLAAITEEIEEQEKIEALCREYLRHASPPEYSGMAHGHIWVCGIMEFNIEDSYYAHGGCCTTQAANVKASLDLAGFASYWIHAVAAESPVNGHSHVYIPRLDMVVDNGRVSRIAYQQSVLCNEFDRERPCVTYLSHNDTWASFYAIEEYCGTLSPAEAIAILEYLSSIHGDEFKGVTDGFAPISYDRLLTQLTAHQDSWAPVTLP